MPVNLWGFVKNPGRYEVPISTDLVQLLSYAGGPLPDADLGSVKVTRIIQRDNQIRKVEYTVNLNHLERLDALVSLSRSGRYDLHGCGDLPGERYRQYHHDCGHHYGIRCERHICVEALDGFRRSLLHVEADTEYDLPQSA